jgi:hypothetical protein
VAAEWVDEWCVRHLGAAPVGDLLEVTAMSEVVGVRLDDGREVVVKRRADQAGRAFSCVRVQRHAAELGFPCARPLTDVTYVDGLAVHAEEWRPGGEIRRGDGPGDAELSARLLAELMNCLDGTEARPPVPNPEWVHWDHDGPRLFPPNPRHEAREAASAVPEWILEVGRRVRKRLLRHDLPFTVGHADWETQNLRWNGDEPHAVHDWDSLAWLTEAGLAGAAAGAFATAEIPTLAPVSSSAAFLDAYQETRGRAFSDAELEIAWAASLWPALHNARAQFLWWTESRLAYDALASQADERLRLAGA